MDKKGISGNGLVAVEFADEGGKFGRFDEAANGYHLDNLFGSATLR